MRKCGILLHPISLSSPYGIGDLGKEAYNFIDFLENAGQKLWQILPFGHTGFGDSPYQSFSTFAGNPLMISPDLLVEDGFLTKEDIATVPEFNQDKIEYSRVIDYKYSLYKKAYKNLENSDLYKDFLSFTKKNDFWINDYALFMAVKNYFIQKRKNEYESKEYKAYYKCASKYMDDNSVKDCYYGGSWNSFPQELSEYKDTAVREYTALLKEEVEFYKFIQYIFFRQWKKLKEYANGKNIEIVGDIPIFVAADSSDVWSNRSLFCVNSKGFPTQVAGVPPDYFSENGQLWGNPLYNWKTMEEDNFSWWVNRVKAITQLVDIVRIDHFRAFESYWSIPYGSETAKTGKWKKGPNKKIFQEIKKQLGNINIIAEDLGDLNPEVLKLRDELGFPGMKILQFAFGNSDNPYFPHNFENNNCVVYTGTHDNDTTVGWYNSCDEKTRDMVRRILNISGENINWDLIRMAISSSGKYCIIPVQDILGYGSDCRMNTPGVAENNWQFRLREDVLTTEIAENLKYLCDLFNR